MSKEIQPMVIMAIPKAFANRLEKFLEYWENEKENKKQAIRYRMNLKEFAEHISKSYSTVYYWCENGLVKEKCESESIEFHDLKKKGTKYSVEFTENK